MNGLEELLDEGEYAQALAAAEEALAEARAPVERAKLQYIAASALFNLDRAEEAEPHLEEAIALNELAEYRALQAYLLMERGAFTESLAAADRALVLDAEHAEAHHVRGLVLSQLDRISEADGAFSRAAMTAPEYYFVPFRIEREAFDRAVAEVVDALPEPFARHLQNVEVAVEDVPGADLVEDGLHSGLLGIYQGDTILASDWDLPDRIILFQRNLENVSPDRATLLREIRDTVLHEVGHHLGMEEEALLAIEEGEDG